MRKVTTLCVLSLAVLVVFGCQSKEDSEPAAEPDYVTVQHILIAFSGTIPGKDITRSVDEARVLAEELFERAKSGEDFDALVKEYTDDRYPGTYRLTNFDAPLMQGAHERKGMVANFGQVAFSLEVGEVGLAKFHPANSPYGWHVIKRLE